MNRSTLRHNRIIALLTCLLMLAGEFCYALPEAPYSYGSQEKSITLYTQDWQDGSSGSYDSAFGFDTLVTPAYATGWTISWKSSDKSIATVDRYGRVLAKKAGTCTITATCSWNGQTETDSIKVTVKKGSDPSGTFFFNSAGGDSSDPDQNLSGGSDQNLSIDSDSSENDVKFSAESLEHDHVNGEMLVVFDKSKSNSEIKDILANHDTEFRKATTIGDDGKAALAEAESEESLQKAMEDLAEEDDVAYVQPNYIYRLNDEVSSDTESSSVIAGSDEAAQESGTVTSLTDDPQFNTQYFHKMIDTKGAWELLKENGISQTATVGVVDSGVDTTHSDLSDNLILNNGKYRKFNGSFASWVSADNIGHGTHVSGIIGALYGNKMFGAGVASGPSNEFCRILPVCIVKSSGDITSIDTVNGIKYAVENGADVVNMSFGSDAKDRAVAEVISDYYYNKGTVFVASGGNKKTWQINDETSIGKQRIECMNFPGEMKEVISVCNINSAGNKHTTSYSGIAKDISAPGTAIYSTYPGDSFVSLTGTSMAAPVVSAVAALMLDANPDLKPQEVRNIICATAVDTEDDYYKSLEVGYGRIDARACVETAYEAGEHARSGSGSGSDDSDTKDKLGFSIKAYYNGEPEPYILDQKQETTTSKSVSKVPSFSASSASKKIRLTFDRASLITTKKTVTYTKCYTRDWWSETATKKTSSTSGVKYQIRVKYGGKTRYYKVSGDKDTTSITVRAGDKTIKADLKKFGSAGFIKGKTYSVAVRAYKSVSGTVKYGKWSKTIKVKVK